MSDLILNIKFLILNILMKFLIEFDVFIKILESYQPQIPLVVSELGSNLRELSNEPKNI